MSISTKKLLNIAGSFGAVFLLAAWMFQHLYAESIAAERRTLASVETHAQSMIVSYNVLDAIDILAGHDITAKKALEDLRVHFFTEILRQYIDVPVFDICLESPRNIASTLKTDLASRCEEAKLFATEGQDAVEKLKPLLKTPVDEFSSDQTEPLVSSLVYSAAAAINEILPIKKKILDSQENANRTLFVLIYLAGSLLIVGSSLIKSIFYESLES